MNREDIYSQLGVCPAVLHFGEQVLDSLKERFEAIDEVAVSKLVRSALVDKEGPLRPVMDLVYAYEHADWDRVSILMIQNHTDMEHISQAYLDALIWDRTLLQSIDDADADQEEAVE